MSCGMWGWRCENSKLNEVSICLNKISKFTSDIKVCFSAELSKEIEIWKDYGNFIQICGKERKWKGMLSNLGIVETKGKAFQF